MQVQFQFFFLCHGCTLGCLTGFHYVFMNKFVSMHFLTCKIEMQIAWNSHTTLCTYNGKQELMIKSCGLSAQFPCESPTNTVSE